ncbi:cytochrome bd-type quinol oxidase, subunit 1 [Mycobacteroides abscessus subsp. abscessus]|nr:cytochrome bd-type quinol oxidase, subunit 1 [Mycobacteroides abscessus subsp. abscessus]
MDPLTIARWQFGITTVYHFFMVPLTLGLGPLVAFFHWRYVRTGAERYKRLTKFWGKLFIINFAMGVATGLVQEFQFGMAWSEYSRFVGDVFGAPLALEGLLAFFFESTFIGLWIFGWGKLKPAIHATTITIAVAGSWASAYFILVANSWMQHPVGVEMKDGRPVMTDIWAVLTNSTALVTVPHVLAGALLVGGAFLVGISWWHLWRRRQLGIDTVADGKVVIGERSEGARDAEDFHAWRYALRFGAVIAIAGFLGTAFTGHAQAQLMIQQQPMKMAAAEAACEDGTSFSVFSYSIDPSSQSCDHLTTPLEVPGLLSFLAYENFSEPVPGVETLLKQYQDELGTHYPDDPERFGQMAGQEITYTPIFEITYYGFRGMFTFGGMSAVVAIYALWITRKKGMGTVPDSRWLKNFHLIALWFPFIGNTAGWVFTEMGRQPFVVAPNFQEDTSVMLFTAAGVSPEVSGGTILFSLITLGSLYAILAVVEIYLLTRYVRAGIPAAMPELVEQHEDSDENSNNRDVLAFAY